MLATFPEFTSLSISDMSSVKNITKKYPSYNEFNFSCMFVWDVSEPVYLSVLNGNLIVKFVDFRKKSYYYSLIGENEIDKTIETLIEHAKAEGIEPELHTVPASVIEQIKDRARFSIKEDQGNNDYILSIPELVQFRTNQYRGKKNLLNRFERKYGEITVYRDIDLTDANTQKEIRRVLENWEGAVPKNSIDIIVEFAAIEKTLRHANNLEVKAFGCYINEVLEAFTIYEKVDSKTVLIHFDKANKDYVGIFEHLKHNLAKHLHFNHNADLINFAQDMDVEGLRAAKQSYHPVGYLKKYSVSLVSQTS